MRCPLSAPDPSGLPSAFEAARLDCQLTGNGYLRLTRHEDGRVTADRVDPATVILVEQPAPALPLTAHSLRRPGAMTSVPVGVYACGCGGTHPLGTSCPDAAAADSADLARDAARQWAAVPSWGRTRTALQESHPALAAALDRLADAHGLAVEK